MTDMLDAALSYAAAGLPVFPVSTAKIPFKGSAGHKDASTDPERIRAMWHDRPEAMVAVATGDRCGFCVLDVDTKEGHGADGRATAKKLGISFAGAVIALTPSGGWHCWFKTGGQALPSKNGLIGPGLDFKADGGYVVAPPSRPDPKKGGYQWVNGSDLSAAAEVPSDIVAALRRTPHERDFLEACQPIRNAAVGTRRTLLNAAAFKFAFQVVAGKLEEKLYRDSLTNAAMTR
jgi:Bifunctional DNA primase/polymerase, N-terminal